MLGYNSNSIYCIKLMQCMKWVLSGCHDDVLCCRFMLLSLVNHYGGLYWCWQNGPSYVQRNCEIRYL